MVLVFIALGLLVTTAEASLGDRLPEFVECLKVSGPVELVLIARSGTFADTKALSRPALPT